MKRIIALIILIALLVTFCGCSLDSIREDILEFREGGFSAVAEDVYYFSSNWLEISRLSASETFSYTFDDLYFDVQTFFSFDYEGVAVGDEDDLLRALEDEGEERDIIIKSTFSITKDIEIPSGKNVIIDNGIILYCEDGATFSVADGASLSLAGRSFVVMNAGSSISVSGEMQIAEQSALLMADAEQFLASSSAEIASVGMIQAGNYFEVASFYGLENAMICATDGAVISVDAVDIGKNGEFVLIDINKSVTIIGSNSGEEATSYFGGMVISAEDVSISGIDFYASNVATSGKTLSYSLYSGASGFAEVGCLFVFADSAQIKDCTFTSGGVAGESAIVVYPVGENTQSYTISSNEYIGYGGDSPTAPVILILEYSSRYSGYGYGNSGDFSIVGSTASGYVSGSDFQDAKYYLAVSDEYYGTSNIVLSMIGENAVSSYTFDCETFIFGDWTVDGGAVVVPEGVSLTISGSSHFLCRENSSMTVLGTVSVSSGSILENFGTFVGSVSGSGEFIDWPNYIEIDVALGSYVDAVVADKIYGQYIGYTVSQLETLYRAYLLSSGVTDISAYNIYFTKSGSDDVLADSYAFEVDCEITAYLEGVSFDVYYDLDGGSTSGGNSGTFIYGESKYLQNATTKKSDEYFAGWVISGGKYDGVSVCVITDELFVDLLDAGYTSLTLKATYTEENLQNVAASVTYSGDWGATVAVYTRGGLEDIDGNEQMIYAESGARYNEVLYLFVEPDDGMMIDKVYLTMASSDTASDITTAVIASMQSGEPLLIDTGKSYTIEVTTKESSTESEIAFMGIYVGERLFATTDFSSMVINVDENLRFVARTADNSSVAYFYVEAYVTDGDGDTEVRTYYDVSAISFDDDYDGGYVYFKVYTLDGYSVLAEDFDFSKTFMIVDSSS